MRPRSLRCREVARPRWQTLSLGWVTSACCRGLSVAGSEGWVAQSDRGGGHFRRVLHLSDRTTERCRLSSAGWRRRKKKLSLLDELVRCGRVIRRASELRVTLKCGAAVNLAPRVFPRGVA